MKPASIENVLPKTEQSGSTVLSRAGTAQMESVQGNDVSIKSTNVGRIEAANHILLGRGRGCSQNPGNQRMHRIINKYRGQYIGNLPAVKRRIVRKVHDEIVEGGAMFLKPAGNGSGWVEVESEVAIQKVAHSLRCRKSLNNKATSIQESSANQMVEYSSTRNNTIPAADSTNLGPEVPQENMMHQEIINQTPAAVTAQLEREVLRRSIAQQQQQALDSDRSLRSLLILQLKAERLQTLALIQSLPFLQPTVASLPELEALQAIEEERKLLRIMASRGNNMWFPPAGL